MRFNLFSFILVTVILLFVGLVWAQAGELVIPTFPVWFVSIVTGLLAPIVSQWGAKNLKTSKQKFFTAMGLTVLCGIVGAFLAKASLNDLPAFFTMAFTFAQISFHAWWKTAFNSVTGAAFKLNSN